MNKLASWVMAGAFGALALTATAGDALCSMMPAPTAPSVVSFSAQQRSCCPQGHCGCTVQAPSPSPAALLSSEVLPRIGEDRMMVAAETHFLGVPSSALQSSGRPESPPAPDKPYKKISQYRI